MDRVILIAFPGAQTLDIAGPAEVFAGASRRRGKRTYAVVLASRAGGVVRTTCGFEIRTRRLDRVRAGPRDTVLVSGGEEGAVLYARRPGFQSQFSEALTAQREAGDPLGAVIARARSRLRELDVPRLARLAGLSERSFYRRCQEHLGVTPAKLVERLRVDHARALLATTTRPLKSIAHESGFSTGERMRSAFERELGVGPREVRLLGGRGTVACESHETG